MHEEVKFELKNWYVDNQEVIDNSKVADLGSNDLNGRVKDTIKHAVGFDIVISDTVDVTIKPGEIPDGHKGIYGVLTSVSSFQFCPDSQLYKQQIIDLLYEGGLLFLTMCTTKCNGNHSTSNNEYGYGDGIRYTMEELSNLFKPEFEIISIYETDNHHPDLILKAMKK